VSKPTARPTAKKPRAKRPVTAPPPPPVVLTVSDLTKSFGQSRAVDSVDLVVRKGSIFGFVGPNGAGKTTTLSMVTGLLRPDSGSVVVAGADVWRDPTAAKRSIGVLPDRMRLFDRLTGAQMLYYCGVLHGLDRETARSRTDDLAMALGLDGSLDRPVRDYSIGMVKKVSLAAALIHSPTVLVLDEPFESVDPVSTAQAVELLKRFAAAGGTVVLSSHNMNLVERVCDAVAVIVGGRILASGTLDEVRGAQSLEERFVELAGGRVAVEGLEWLTTFSD
jgi:ABC-2 type transport system ATP-binding protein